MRKSEEGCESDAKGDGPVGDRVASFLQVVPVRLLPGVQAFLLGAMKFHCYVRALPAAPAPATAVLLDAVLTGGSPGGEGSGMQKGWAVG